MKIGIIICDRYKSCDGGKCFRSVNNREGAFKRYPEENSLEVVSYSTCGGCPGGNVENVVAGMKNYGAEAIHFATGVLAGYPPCKYLDTLVNLAKLKTELPVVVGTHPMPTNYIAMHKKLGDWSESHKKMINEYNLVDEEESMKYDSSIDGYLQNLRSELEK